VVVGGDDLVEVAELLAVDHPPALVDEVEAAVLVGPGARELDLVARDDAQALHGGRLERINGCCGDALRMSNAPTGDPRAPIAVILWVDGRS
jgi:hypothetical protein